MPETVLNNSVKKAFQLLEVFSLDKPEWGVTELAKKVNSNKSTVYRLLNTLQLMGAVHQNPLNERYRLGTKLFELGNRLSLKQVLIPLVHTYLQEVAEQITETVQMGILVAKKVLIIDQVVSPLGLRLSNETGSSLPLHATAAGKVLLAGIYPHTELLDSLKVEKFTDDTISDISILKCEMEEIKKQGFCLEKEEFERGLISLSLPVFNERKKVIAAISVSGPASRFKESKLAEYIQIVKKASKNIEVELIKLHIEEII